MSAGSRVAAEVNTVHHFLKLAPACGFWKSPSSRDCSTGGCGRARILLKAPHLAYRELETRRPVCLCWCTLEINLGIQLKELANGTRCTKTCSSVFRAVFVSLARQGGLSKEICK